jgi:surface antigen
MKPQRSLPGIALILGVLLTALAGTSPALSQEPKVEFEITEGTALVHVPGVNLSEIDDIVWGGRSILDRLHDEKLIEDASGGAVFGLPADFRFEGPGVVEIHLRNGDTLVRGIPDDTVLRLRAAKGDVTKATCNTALMPSLSCGGTTTTYASPYKCCDNDGNGSLGPGDGNCVWLAWVKAREYGWLVPSTWGNATDWCDKAMATPGWSVSSTAQKNTIACNKTLGHVAWVTDVTSTSFTVTEQNCKVEASNCYGSGTQTKSRTFSSNWKFIKCADTTKCGASVSTAQPSITSVLPNPVTGSNSPQSFTINGSNFVTGANVTLRDITASQTYTNRTASSFSATQIVLSTNFSTAAHTWSVEVINPNGKTSGQYQFTVRAPAGVPPSISSVSPNPVTGSNSPQAFTINGSSFVSGANVTLRDITANQTFANRSASSFSNTRIVLSPNFSTAVHTWSVEVINPNGQSSGQYQFQVR